jgi:hypothetical protein
LSPPPSPKKQNSAVGFTFLATFTFIYKIQILLVEVVVVVVVVVDAVVVVAERVSKGLHAVMLFLGKL